MKNRKNVVLIVMIVAIMINIFSIKIPKSFASTDNTIYISLSDNSITVDDKTITEDTSEKVYLSNIMNNGGSSEDATDANIEITNIININSSGTYEFTGTLSDGQISVNSNDVEGEVTIILNNVDITCKNAPAIFIYNTDTNSSTCKVTIKTSSESNNTITGGKLKQSVEGWSDQEELLYYIDKGYDDDRSYYERYKYDAAISSDISLIFEGEGSLTVNSTEKEGIESKRDITINSGNYTINSLDDGINASADNESVITINGGTILVNVQEDAEEGDGIDSNGYIYINDGYVYAFACENSQDNGLDSDSGIYINGGYIVSTGNMADTVNDDSEQEFMQLQFNEKVEKGTLITITDENKNPIVAFESDRAYSILTISTPDFTDGEHYVYEGGNIDGTSKNGLYTEITSYEEGTEKEYNTTTDREMSDSFGKNIDNNNMKPNSNIYYYSILVFGILLIILIIVIINLKKKGEFEMKGKILTLIIGILIGAIITAAGFMIYNKLNVSDEKGMRGGQMQNDGERPDGRPTDMENGDENFSLHEKPSDDNTNSDNNI